MALFDIKPKLELFKNRLIEKAGMIHQETEQVTRGSTSLSQSDAVKVAQLRIRALVLLDVADIIASLLTD